MTKKPDGKTLLSNGVAGQTSEVFVVAPGQATMLLIGGANFAADVQVTMGDPTTLPNPDIYVTVERLVESGYYALPPGFRGVRVHVASGAVDTVQATGFTGNVVNVTRDVSAQFLEDLETARLAAIAAGNTQLAPILVRLGGLEVAQDALTERTATTETQSAVSTATLGLLTPRVTGLEGGVTSLQGEMHDTERDVSALQSDVTGLLRDVGGLEGRVTSAEGQGLSQGAAITALTTRLSAAEAKGTANGAAVSALTPRVATLETDGASLAGRVGAVEGQAAGNSAALGTLTPRVTTLEGGVTALGNRTTTVEGQAASNTTALGNLTPRVAALEGRSAGVDVRGYLNPPANPAAGTQWYESTFGRLLTYDGGAWRTPAGVLSVGAANGMRTLFKDDAVGGLPAGWTRYWDSNATSLWSVVTRDGAPGGRVLQGHPKAAALEQAPVVLGPSDINSLNTEILVRAKLPPVADYGGSGGSAFYLLGVALRVSGNVATNSTLGANGYVLRFALNTADYMGMVELQRIKSTSGDSSAAVTNPTLYAGAVGPAGAKPYNSMRPGETWYVRFRAAGTQLLGKWWRQGEAEPGWMVGYNDGSPLPAGSAGVYVATSTDATPSKNAAVDYELVAIGTGGQPAVY